MGLYVAAIVTMNAGIGASASAFQSATLRSKLHADAPARDG